VALSSGTIATVLFFRTNDMVRRDPTALAAVEAMQAAELLHAVRRAGDHRRHRAVRLG
jgi:hypothetical protein